MADITRDWIILTKPKGGYRHGIRAADRAVIGAKINEQREAIAAERKRLGLPRPSKPLPEGELVIRRINGLIGLINMEISRHAKRQANPNSNDWRLADVLSQHARERRERERRLGRSASNGENRGAD